nr:P-loop NTPase fold protein [uncultured Sphingomonas sp.]
MNPIDEIWKGDKLNRRTEARRLERFLNDETEELARLGREQALVLALDAQYGEGKSWFLSRFRQQLQINHPVAFVDAWVDDANNEPLVSIMAALDDALQPFLKKRNVKNRLGALTRAALPIMGKAALGAAGKVVSRHIGEDFGDQVKITVAEAQSRNSEVKKGDNPVEAGVDKFFEGVSQVVDNAGKALLDQYRARQRSRETFKENLRQLASSVQSSTEDPRHAPIFIIVDELDRCRPSYAIGLLEEIKHLFDVPGVVFVIALHGQQLTKSIEAVYGAKFDASAYLRRFFTRHYGLRKLSLEELVKAHFHNIQFHPHTFSAPPVYRSDTEIIELPAPELAGRLLTEWEATPREAQAVIDGLRLFTSEWDHSGTPIELPLVLVLLLNAVQGEQVAAVMERPTVTRVEFVIAVDRNASSGQPERISSKQMFNAYQLGMGNNLHIAATSQYNFGPNAYMVDRLRMEYLNRYNGVTTDRFNPPTSTWSEYVERVKGIGSFIIDAD